MRKLLLASVALAGLSMGSAIAGDNVSEITQVGNGNDAEVSQTGVVGRAFGTQNGSGNVLRQNQTGFGGRVDTTQIGSGNVALSTQHNAAQGRVTQHQNGAHNRAEAMQTGGGVAPNGQAASANISQTQRDSYNRAIATQIDVSRGTSVGPGTSTIMQTQDGHGNVASAAQTNVYTGVGANTPLGSEIKQEQYGNNNSVESVQFDGGYMNARVVQSGDWNRAFTNQGATTNLHATINQSGNNNYARTTQR